MNGQRSGTATSGSLSRLIIICGFNVEKYVQLNIIDGNAV